MAPAGGDKGLVILGSKLQTRPSTNMLGPVNEGPFNEQRTRTNPGRDPQ